MLEGRWQDRYLDFIREFGDAEEGLASLEKLIRDTGYVGKAAEACLEKMSIDDMGIETIGMVILLIEYRRMQKK
jgi:hypothetical protein